jgi:hypothetical protein
LDGPAALPKTLRVSTMTHSYRHRADVPADPPVELAALLRVLIHGPNYPR